MRWSAGDDATIMRGLPGATIRTEVAVMTVRRTTVLLLNRLALESLAGPSALLISRPGFGNQPTSRSTARETNPELWLADYRLACQLGGADDDLLIIRNLPLLLSDSA